MPKRRYLTLSQEQYTHLTHIRDRDKRPYLREKAAALLKIAQGQSAHQVAQNGLLRPRKADTVYAWMDDFEQHGCLRSRPACRGPFSPARRATPGASGNAAPSAS